MATIYGLTCHVTNKIYVGISKDISKRFREHRSLLRHGKHFEPELQNDWIKYGEGQFYMSVLQDLPEMATMVEKQQAEVGWMDKNGDRLYNSRRIGLHQTGLGKKQSLETRKKRSMATLGIPKNHGAKISATKQRKKLMMYAALTGKETVRSDG